MKVYGSFISMPTPLEKTNKLNIIIHILTHYQHSRSDMINSLMSASLYLN